MVKRYREYAYTSKKKKKNYKKKLRKVTKRARKTLDTGVKIWRAVNSKKTQKSLKSAGKRAQNVSDYIMNRI